MAVRVLSAGIHSNIFGFTITQVSPVARCTQSMRKRAFIGAAEGMTSWTRVTR